jgi:hypothetical protein
MEALYRQVFKYLLLTGIGYADQTAHARSPDGSEAVTETCRTRRPIFFGDDEPYLFGSQPRTRAPGAIVGGAAFSVSIAKPAAAL